MNHLLPVLNVLADLNFSHFTDGAFYRFTDEFELVVSDDHIYLDFSRSAHSRSYHIVLFELVWGAWPCVKMPTACDSGLSPERTFVLILTEGQTAGTV